MSIVRVCVLGCLVGGGKGRSVLLPVAVEGEQPCGSSQSHTSMCDTQNSNSNSVMPPTRHVARSVDRSAASALHMRTTLPACLPACLPAWLPACLPACLCTSALAQLHQSSHPILCLLPCPPHPTQLYQPNPHMWPPITISSLSSSFPPFLPTNLPTSPPPYQPT